MRFVRLNQVLIPIRPLLQKPKFRERFLAPSGRLHPFSPVSAVPAGLFISHCPTQDSVLRTSVLGYIQIAPTGLELQSRVLTQTLKPGSLSGINGPTKVVP